MSHSIILIVGILALAGQSLSGGQSPPVVEVNLKASLRSDGDGMNEGGMDRIGGDGSGLASARQEKQGTNQGTLKAQEVLQGGSRGLQQEGKVTVVTTARALLKAIASGAAHIEIQAHLDLTELPGDGDDIDSNDIAKSLYLLGVIPPSVKSIQGNCVTAAPTFTPPANHAPLRPLLPRQCLVLTDYQIMWIDGPLWLDGLYIRLKSPRKGSVDDERSWDGGSRFLIVVASVELDARTSSTSVFLEPAEPDAPEPVATEVWLTQVTVQGNGDIVQDNVGLHVIYQSAVYAEDCTFAEIGSTRAIVRIASGSTLSMVNCIIANNTISQRDDDGAGDYTDAVIQAEAYIGHRDDTTSGQRPDTEVRLEGCTFSGNNPATLPTLLTHDSGYTDSEGTDDGQFLAVFYGDSSSPSVCDFPEGTLHDHEMPCNESRPRPLSEAGDTFLTASNPWLLQTQQDARKFPRSFDSSSKGVGAGAIAGGVVAAVVVLLACVAGILLFVHHKRNVTAAAAASKHTVTLPTQEIQP